MVKRVLEKARRNKALLFGLALALIAPMMPGYVAQAGVEVDSVYVDLNDAVFSENDENEKFVSFPNVEVNDDTYHTIFVSVDEGAVNCEKVTPPTMVNREDADGNVRIAAWVNQDGFGKNEVETILKGLIFEYKEGMIVEVTIDKNEVSGDFNGSMTITKDIYEANGHYYIYVPYCSDEKVYDENYKISDANMEYYANSSWIEAYNYSKSFTFMGMKGYLATITSDNEAKFLHEINDKGAWCAGTMLTYPGGQLIEDELSINTKNASADKPILVEKEVDGSGNPVKAEKNNAADNRKLYYWACGPEAGTPVDAELWDETQDEAQPNYDTVSDKIEAKLLVDKNFLKDPMKYNENCAIANFHNQVGLNDILQGNYNDNEFNSSNSGARSYGYYIEFGGYTSGEYKDPEIQTEKVKLQSVEAKITITNGSITSVNGGDKAADTIQDTTKVFEEQVYKAFVKPNENSELPDAIVVTVASENDTSETLKSGTDYTWNPETGEIVVNADKVTGNIDIKVVCEALKYDVTDKVSYGSITTQTSNGDTSNFEDTDLTDNISKDEDVATPNKEYTAIIKVQSENYKLPENVKVTVGNEVLEQVTDGTPTPWQFLWDITNGKVTIPGGSVTDDIVIEADCVGKYDVTDDVTGAYIDWPFKDDDGEENEVTDLLAAVQGDDYKATIKPEDGYLLPNDITVSITSKDGNPKVLQSSNINDPDEGEFCWNPSTGELIIAGESIDGNITISGEAIKLHDVIEGISKAKIVKQTTDGATIPTSGEGDGEKETFKYAAKDKKDYIATIEPDEGYKLPEELTITVGNTNTPLNKDIDGNLVGGEYSWVIDEKTGKGTLTIAGADVTDDIKIEGDIIPVVAYDVTDAVQVGDITTQTSDSITTGFVNENGDDSIRKTDKGVASGKKEYKATIKSDSGKTLPDAILVMVGDKVLTMNNPNPGTGEYSWIIGDNGEGTLTIPGENVTGNIIISDYTAQGNADNAAYTGNSFIVPGVKYTGTFKPASGYVMDKNNITVTVTKPDGTGTTTLEYGKDYTWSVDADGNGTIVVLAEANVSGNIVIQANAITKPVDDNNDDKDDDDDDDDSYVANTNTNNTTTPPAQVAGTSSAPKTGDSMNILLYVVLLLGATGGLAGCIVLKKRNQKEK